MSRAGLKIAKDLIQRQKESCKIHILQGAEPYELPDGRVVCSKCGKAWRDLDE